MADISKINVLGTSYNIKDAYARDILNNLNNKKYIFIGDSYGELAGQDTWIDVVINKLGLTSSDYYRNTLGSTGFKNYNASTNKRFINLLQDVAGDLSTSEKNEITDIIVCGGANDSAYTTADEIEVYIADFMSYAVSTFPNAKVYVGCIGYTMNPTNKYNMQNVMQAYNNVVNYGGIYLKGCENAIHDYRYFLHSGAWVTSDQVHPNQEGSTRIGIAVYDAFTKGYASVTHNVEQNNTSTGFNYLFSSQNNDVYTLYFKNEYVLSFSHSTYVLSPSNPVELFDFAPTVIGGFISGKELKFPCRPVLRTNDEDIYIDGYLSLEAYVYNNQIRQRLVFYPNVYDTSEGGVGGYKQYENTVSLIFQPDIFKFTSFEC